MRACPSCGGSVADEWAYCAACGTALPGTPARALRIHLDDVLYNCQRCGKEARYAELPRCVVCKEPNCGDCVERCSECESLSCRTHVVECSACKRTGCANCFDVCETCEVRGLCPEHSVGCEDCGYPTCEECLDGCRKCGLDVCSFCLEAHKSEKR